jgi:hypothetical protein
LLAVVSARRGEFSLGRDDTGGGRRLVLDDTRRTDGGVGDDRDQSSLSSWIEREEDDVVVVVGSIVGSIVSGRIPPVIPGAADDGRRRGGGRGGTRRYVVGLGGDGCAAATATGARIMVYASDVAMNVNDDDIFLLMGRSSRHKVLLCCRVADKPRCSLIFSKNSEFASDVLLYSREYLEYYCTYLLLHRLR